MRKLILVIILSIYMLIFSLASALARQVVNVYNWGGYMPQEVIRLFEKQTGIHVNYSTYDSNEVLYTKLKSSPDEGGYDVVFPSANYVDRMIQEHMLHKLDSHKLPHMIYLNPTLLNRSYDPNNHYSVPYLWGVNGIAVNDQYYHPQTIKKWADLWSKRFKGQLLVMDDARDIFAVSMRVLGYSINDTNPKHIHQAYLKLKQLLPNIKLFGLNNIDQIFCDGDATIGVIESGDASLAKQCNPHIHYIYPKREAVIWIDNMVIPKTAPHVANAYRFIDFILQPKIALMISEYVGNPTPNLGAVKLMPKSMQQDPILNPTAEDLIGSQLERYINNKSMSLYLHYWQMLKLEASS